MKAYLACGMCGYILSERHGALGILRKIVARKTVNKSQKLARKREREREFERVKLNERESERKI